MNKTLLALYGLKWNPFAPGVPAEALHVSPRVDSFCRRVRHLVAEGGFAVVTGDPGTGKSACLRILADQLAGERELAIRNLDRDSNMLRQIQGALARIAGGSYGVCRHCEEDISPRRVNAVPWASFCIKCQEQLDRHEIEVDDTVRLFATAA